MDGIEPYPPGYEAIREVLATFVSLYNRLEVRGLEHLPPPREGALICCNHEGFSDPFFIGAAIPNRYVRGLVEKTSYDLPLIHPFLKAMGAVPVPVQSGGAIDKGGALLAIETLATHMRAGDLGLIFPEGIIKFWVDRPELKRFRPGGVRAAAMARVPVIPAAIYGSRYTIPSIAPLRIPRAGRSPLPLPLLAPVLLPVKVMVAFGPAMPIDPSTVQEREVALAEAVRVRERVLELYTSLAQAYRRRFFASGARSRGGPGRLARPP